MAFSFTIGLTVQYYYCKTYNAFICLDCSNRFDIIDQSYLKFLDHSSEDLLRTPDQNMYNRSVSFKVLF